MSELLKINVNEHTEKKNGLTYLSWAWAWAEVLKIDAKASWRLMKLGAEECPAVFFPDGSAMVGVCVTIKGDAKSCVLPVMNHRNQAIKNPDSFAINTAIMRCLAKAIAMHGLGLYIYSGEDLPEEGAEKVQAVVIKATDGVEDMVHPDRQHELDHLAVDMIEAFKNGRQMDAVKWFYDPDSFTDNEERVYLWRCLSAESKLRAFIKSNNPNKAAA